MYLFVIEKVKNNFNFETVTMVDNTRYTINYYYKIIITPLLHLF